MVIHHQMNEVNRAPQFILQSHSVADPCFLVARTEAWGVMLLFFARLFPALHWEMRGIESDRSASALGVGKQQHVIRPHLVALNLACFRHFFPDMQMRH